MSKSEIIKSDFNGLNEFIKGLKSGFVVDVGIMGDKTTRADIKSPVAHGTAEAVRFTNTQGNDRSYKPSAGLSNADVGFIHEFGTNKIPKRSFLRMPIFQRSEQILEQVKKAGALKKLAQGKMISVLADIGVACEAVILQAFASSGWGSWAAKKSGKGWPLIDTGQLRRSIASVVTQP